jgi:hypothetical protein
LSGGDNTDFGWSFALQNYLGFYQEAAMAFTQLNTIGPSV